MSVDALVDRVGGDPGYIKFLITERYAIRSALMARGVCLDEEARTLAYPTSIGNSLHLDLIEVERWLATLPMNDRKLLDDWATRQSTKPFYGGSQVGRVNRIVKEYIDGAQEASGEAIERPGTRVPLQGAPGAEREASAEGTAGLSGVLPSDGDHRAG